MKSIIAKIMTFKAFGKKKFSSKNCQKVAMKDEVVLESNFFFLLFFLFLCSIVSPLFFSRIFYGSSFLGATFLHNDVDDDSTSICCRFWSEKKISYTIFWSFGRFSYYNIYFLDRRSSPSRHKNDLFNYSRCHNGTFL